MRKGPHFPPRGQINRRPLRLSHVAHTTFKADIPVRSSNSGYLEVGRSWQCCGSGSAYVFAGSESIIFAMDPDPEMNLAYFHRPSPLLSHLIFHHSSLSLPHLPLTSHLLPYPSSFIFHLSPHLPHPSSFIPHTSSLTPHPSSFITGTAPSPFNANQADFS